MLRHVVRTDWTFYFMWLIFKGKSVRMQLLFLYRSKKNIFNCKNIHTAFSAFQEFIFKSRQFKDLRHAVAIP